MSRRILFVVNHAGFFLSHRLPVALAAKAAGYDVIIATPKSRHVPQIQEAGLQWTPVPITRSGTNPVKELMVLLSLYQLYRRIRPDLVHHVTTKPVLYGTLAARLSRVPAVVNAVSGLGHVFVEGRRMSGFMRIAISLGYRIALRHRRMRVIFQNIEQRDSFVRNEWVRQDDTVLIPGSGVDTQLFSPRTLPEPQPPLVAFISRMLRTKGVYDFVAAAGILKGEGVQARFALVGDPDPDNPASVSLEQLQRWEREGVVEYWGRRNDISAVLHETAIMCLPTFYPEGVPKCLIEAASSGIPIVTTNHPGCNSIVLDGVNGFLVPVHTPVKVADSLRTLIQDPGLRSRFGIAGRRRAIAGFSLQKVVEAHLQTYAALLSPDDTANRGSSEPLSLRSA